uniref:Uncharacterized protein n=1 Tax=Oryza glaberrima TaxID=4538 RepID=I1NK22_ORYGL
ASEDSGKQTETGVRAWSIQVQESPPLDGNRSARDAASQAAGRRQFRAPQIPPASASIVYVTDLPVVRRWIRTLQHPMLPCMHSPS